MSEAGAVLPVQAYPDGDALAEAASELIARSLADGLQRAGRATFVATGGSTPAAAYRRLAAADIDWSMVAITLSDERWVPPSDRDSNERMVREHLLTGPAAAARFTPLWSPQPTPDAAASAAEPAIAAMTPFDTVLLGMGDDGHIASLFPGSPVLDRGLDPRNERLCIAVPPGQPAPPQARISLTLRALLQAKAVVLLITGSAKRGTIEAAMAGADLPVRRLLLHSRTPVAILWCP